MTLSLAKNIWYFYRWIFSDKIWRENDFLDRNRSHLYSDSCHSISSKIWNWILNHNQNTRGTVWGIIWWCNRRYHMSHNLTYNGRWTTPTPLVELFLLKLLSLNISPLFHYSIFCCCLMPLKFSHKNFWLISTVSQAKFLRNFNCFAPCLCSRVRLRWPWTMLKVTLE